MTSHVESDVLKMKSLDKQVKTADWYINSNILRLTNQELPIKTNIPRMACQEYYVKSVKRGVQKVVCQESHAKWCQEFLPIFF